MPTFDLNSDKNQSDELFNTSLSDVSKEEEDFESVEDYSDIFYFVYSYKTIGEKEGLIEQENTDYEIRQNNSTKIGKEKTKTIVSKSNKKAKKAKKPKKCKKKGEIRDFVRNLKNTENKIIRHYGYKQRITLGKYEDYLENKPLEEINRKTLKETFVEFSPKNAEIISYVKKLERKKGKTLFRELNKLTFEEMYDFYIQDCKWVISGIHVYNLTRIFKTLKDVLKQKNKKLRKKQLKMNEKRYDDKEREKPMEIE